MLAAIERMHLTLPIVVRLDGTNEAEGRALLAAAGKPNLVSEPTMLGARRAVELAAAAGDPAPPRPVFPPDGEATDGHPASTSRAGWSSTGSPDGRGPSTPCATGRTARRSWPG